MKCHKIKLLLSCPCILHRVKTAASLLHHLSITINCAMFVPLSTQMPIQTHKAKRENPHVGIHNTQPFLSIFTCFCLSSNYTTQTLCNLVSLKFPTPVLYASLPTWVLTFRMSSGTYHAILSSMNMGSNITHHGTCGLKFRTSGKTINFSLFLV